MIPTYLRLLAPLTTLLGLLAAFAGLLYPPLRDQSALVPAVALVVLLAVMLVTAVVHLGWRRLELDIVHAVETNPAGTLTAVETAAAPLISAAGHSPAEIIAATSELLTKTIAALPPAPAPPG